MNFLSRPKSAIQEALEAVPEAGVIALALGLPPHQLFPVKAISAASQACMNNSHTFQYGRPSEVIKQFIADYLLQRGVHCSPQMILLTTGAQQALSLVAELLGSPERTFVLVDEAVYPGFRQVAETHGYRCRAVPSNRCGDGIDLEAANLIVKQCGNPAFIYTMSVGHNPLTRSLNYTARRNLVAFASAHNTVIVEDDVYGVYQYDGANEQSLMAVSQGNVISIGSFSKLLAPSLRVGWIVAPSETMGTLAVLKEASDLNVQSLSQAVVAELIQMDMLSHHVELLKKELTLRRDAMHDALLRYMGGAAQWSRPSAGFFVWLTLRDNINTSDFLQIAIKHGVSYIPGEAFAVSPEFGHSRALRLCFASYPPSEIKEGVSRIASALQHVRCRR